MASIVVYQTICVWITFVIFVYIITTQVRYSKSKLSNTLSHYFLGSLIYYYSLFVQTVILYDIKTPSLRLCDALVGIVTGIALLITQHDFFKKQDTTSEWSEKDRQHTYLGIVLLVVGICNALNYIIIEKVCNNIIIIKTKNNNFMKLFVSFSDGSLGIGLIGIGLVIYFHKQGSMYAIWLHIFFCIFITLTGFCRMIMNQLSFRIKIIGCTFGMASGSILLLAARHFAMYFSQVNIHPLIIIFICILFVSIVSYFNVYVYYEKKKIDDAIKSYEHIENVYNDDDDSSTSSNDMSDE